MGIESWDINKTSQRQTSETASGFSQSFVKGHVSKILEQRWDEMLEWDSWGVRLNFRNFWRSWREAMISLFDDLFKKGFYLVNVDYEAFQDAMYNFSDRISEWRTLKIADSISMFDEISRANCSKLFFRSDGNTWRVIGHISRIYHTESKDKKIEVTYDFGKFMAIAWRHNLQIRFGLKKDNIERALRFEGKSWDIIVAEDLLMVEWRDAVKENRELPLKETKTPIIDQKTGIADMKNFLCWVPKAAEWECLMKLTPNISGKRWMKTNWAEILPTKWNVRLDLKDLAWEGVYVEVDSDHIQYLKSAISWVINFRQKLDVLNSHEHKGEIWPESCNLILPVDEVIQIWDIISWYWIICYKLFVKNWIVSWNVISLSKWITIAEDVISGRIFSMSWDIRVSGKTTNLSKIICLKWTIYLDYAENSEILWRDIRIKKAVWCKIYWDHISIWEAYSCEISGSKVEVWKILDTEEAAASRLWSHFTMISIWLADVWSYRSEIESANKSIQTLDKFISQRKTRLESMSKDDPEYPNLKSQLDVFQTRRVQSENSISKYSEMIKNIESERRSLVVSEISLRWALLIKAWFYLNRLDWKKIPVLDNVDAMADSIFGNIHFEDIRDVVKIWSEEVWSEGSVVFWHRYLIWEYEKKKRLEEEEASRIVSEMRKMADNMSDVFMWSSRWITLYENTLMINEKYAKTPIIIERKRSNRVELIYDISPDRISFLNGFGENYWIWECFNVRFSLEFNWTRNDIDTKAIVKQILNLWEWKNVISCIFSDSSVWVQDNIYAFINALESQDRFNRKSWLLS